MKSASSGAWKRGGGALEQFSQTPASGDLPPDSSGPKISQHEKTVSGFVDDIIGLACPSPPPFSSFCVRSSAAEMRVVALVVSFGIALGAFFLVFPRPER